jgi:NhaA family Na+:H+ antiporter
MLPKAVLRPFQEFVKLEASSGILLFVCAMAALVWANSPWAAVYDAIWKTPLKLGFGDYALTKPLLLWINDGLMAVFFFLVGMEIKRELLEGELTSPRQAALSIAAALGGMAIPAALYLAVNAGGETAAGWAIPMATDIAFALGVLAVLGSRAPPALKVFVTALAIVDDLAAVAVIALFYTSQIRWLYLGIAALVWIGLAAMGRARVRWAAAYILAGIALWLLTLLSGVHATIAGVLLALTIPLREPALLPRFEHSVHPWVAYLILPVFSLANAGVSLSGDLFEALSRPVAAGVVLGLVAGKPLGVVLSCWLAVRTGIAEFPPGLGWPQLFGAGCLAGIGFTMSLFIGGLAFAEPRHLDSVKLGVLAASLNAGAAGAAVLLLSHTSTARADRSV